ncbi:hypothetical protein EDEG_02518 [Edhazardia aedis USNM 41457]|uniref:Homologous-pairing protein 2 winged helix domain-containing protein n=1 Tax=Edhazardia aedis (strain USNM 41457) TaxID=1003232 RepID=J9DKK0_EDHAE|nr:hypothetical protein EDEG_02518 [Edhazardia aedis USNM 41457]|eukprot:EJW03110.1 hypothetical protein EDEG_02518 [Edhazardia aedis USNM 41457]
MSQNQLNEYHILNDTEYSSQKKDEKNQNIISKEESLYPPYNEKDGVPNSQITDKSMNLPNFDTFKDISEHILVNLKTDLTYPENLFNMSQTEQHTNNNEKFQKSEENDKMEGTEILIEEENGVEQISEKQTVPKSLESSKENYSENKCSNNVERNSIIESSSKSEDYENEITQHSENSETGSPHTNNLKENLKKEKINTVKTKKAPAKGRAKVSMPTKLRNSRAKAASKASYSDDESTQINSMDISESNYDTECDDIENKKKKSTERTLSASIKLRPKSLSRASTDQDEKAPKRQAVSRKSIGKTASGKKSPEELAKIVHDFMKTKSRPYPISELVLIFKDDATKPTILAACDDLAEKNILIKKENGKSVLYLINKAASNISDDEIKSLNRKK